MLLLADYRARFPEHSDVSDADVQLCIDAANDDVNSEYLGTMYSRALLYYAAHFVQIEYVDTQSSAFEGAVKSRTVGPVSITFDTGNSASHPSDLFDTTSYGQRYKQVVSRMFGPVAY
jgi:hypothetical protein